MCGFVALMNQARDQRLEAVVRRTLGPIAHRGPDDVGISIDGSVGLGFRRLSILDLSPKGHQPMHSSDGQCTIVFNGEIYNYLELRAELERVGHQFRSQGDTEVLLAAYREWGVDCVSRLNGMWAFVIHDRTRGCLFGSRDRFGIKPLYRYQTGSYVVLASEIKAIRASGLHTGVLNKRVCASFLHFDELDRSAETFFEGIVNIAAGHSFEFTMDGHYREWPYWDLRVANGPAPNDPPHAFAELFEDAMRLHMRSDVPVGVNLSGGLDSTSILCSAARLKAESGASAPLLAFCYQDKGFDESLFIRDTLNQTGAQLVPLEISPVELWDSLPTVLSFQDEPVHSMTALVGYHLMALAARHGVKVILNGQGADEVIGGYGNYFGERWAELILSGRWRKAWSEIAAYSQAHGGRPVPRFRRALKHVAQSAMAGLPAYRALADCRRLRRAAASDWLRPETASKLPRTQDRQLIGLSGILAASVNRAPLPLYLRVEDRNSMAHSVEVRLPFLDYRLVNLVFNMGSEWKINGAWNKHVLRQGMTGRIPESVRTRLDKMGFPTDARAWFSGPLYGRLREVMSDIAFHQFEYFDGRVIASNLEAHRRGEVVHTGRIFKALQFYLWHRGIAH